MQLFELLEKIEKDANNFPNAKDHITQLQSLNVQYGSYDVKLFFEGIEIILETNSTPKSLKNALLFLFNYSRMITDDQLFTKETIDRLNKYLNI